MGKRSRTKQSKGLKILEFKPSPSKTSEDSLRPKLLETAYSKYDNSTVLLELQTAIRGIYKEYLKDLKLRKQRRLESKVPTSDTQHYNLIINNNYRNLMRSKITELLSKNYRCSLEIITDETLEYFIGKLEKFIGEADEKSRLLQMVYMHEAYHSLRNSISQISKIFTELYPEQEFTQSAMKKFYETVLIRHKKNLKFARCQDSSHFAIDFILRIYGEFEIFMQTGKYSSENILFDDESNIEENIGESVYSLPLDEVLRYINGPSQAPKIQVSQDFEENMARLDKEILDFENRLAVTQPLISRPAPLCSFEFLQSLTDRYHKIRKDLLSN